MSVNEKKSFIPVFIGLILLASIYFIYRAVIENTELKQQNPFSLNIDKYKLNDSTLNQWTEGEAITIPLETPNAICEDGQGGFFVSGADAVIRFNAEGFEKSRIAIASTATCLAFDKQDRLFIAKRDHIEIYSGLENADHWESLREKSYITAIALSAEYIYLADAGSRVIWKFNNDGRLLSRIGRKKFVIPSPFFDLGLDSAGNLWAANTGKHRLEMYDSTGRRKRYFGKYSMKINGFCGCCNPAHFIIRPDGSFITSEKGLLRVKEYSAAGELQAVVAGPDKFEKGTVLDLATGGPDLIYVLDSLRGTVRVFKKKQTG